jgi:putative effector of murein hydrolase
MLGPATVALAIPLLNNGRTVIKNLWPILAALFVGSVTAILTAIGLATALGLPREAILALAPKSTTAAVAMGISETVGGPPELTAVMVILTGIIGAILVTPLMNTLRISDYAARGFAVGLTAHGIGTARAFTVNPLAGTFAGIALVLNAILTALLVPTLLVWMDAVLG